VTPPADSPTPDVLRGSLVMVTCCRLAEDAEAIDDDTLLTSALSVIDDNTVDLPFPSTVATAAAVLVSFPSVYVVSIVNTVDLGGKAGTAAPVSGGNVWKSASGGGFCSSSAGWAPAGAWLSPGRGRSAIVPSSFSMKPLGCCDQKSLQ
jgi:hypothetical protein